MENNEITYIGIKEEKLKPDRAKKSQENEPFKQQTKNKKIDKLISKTKKKFISKKIILILIAIILICYFKPITTLRNILDAKREYYAQIKGTNEHVGILESLIYSFGIDYYKNCNNTMMMPADGLITCQYDLSHKGIDIACDIYQDNIYAAASGYVYSIEYSEDYGNELILEHNINGIKIYTFYGNLSKINVSQGQYVYQNEVIAQEGGPQERAIIMDTTGHHIHFEVRKTPKKGSGLNPNIFLIK